MPPKGNGIFTEAEELRVFRIADIVIERHTKKCPHVARLKAWACGVSAGLALAGFLSGLALKDVIARIFGG